MSAQTAETRCARQRQSVLSVMLLCEMVNKIGSEECKTDYKTTTVRYYLNDGSFVYEEPVHVYGTCDNTISAYMDKFVDTPRAPRTVRTKWGDGKFDVKSFYANRDQSVMSAVQTIYTKRPHATTREDADLDAGDTEELDQFLRGFAGTDG